MEVADTNVTVERQNLGKEKSPHRLRAIVTIVAIPIIAAGSFFLWRQMPAHQQQAQPQANGFAPKVSVSEPLVKQIPTTMKLLGQFSAINRVELRAQVGGVLSQINFTDGQIVNKGDLLFVIDTRPFEIRIGQAAAAVKTAEARLTLTKLELWRAQQLKKANFASAETVDQRQAEQDAALAALASAQQSELDARLDLEFAHVTAPFAGRISTHLVSVGNLVSGSRGGSSPTTLLTTIVSLDPIWLDFDMSEHEYIEYQKNQQDGSRPDKNQVALHLSGEKRIYRGALDFIDNAINNRSGTIHARATVSNPDRSLVPGEFAELELTVGAPKTAYLIPGSAVVLDQSEHFVMTVAADNTVVPKQVSVGGQFKGLQIIRDGLTPTDQVIVDGLAFVRPGAKVDPEHTSIETARTEPQTQ
jgi:multidrug efflux system membrane fusion protein